MGHRADQLPIRTTLAGTDWIIGTDTVEMFRITGSDLGASTGGGGGGGGGTSNHSLLTNLGNDDHPQYFNQARGDERYAPAIATNVRLNLIESQMVAGAVISSFLIKCVDDESIHRVILKSQTSDGGQEKDYFLYVDPEQSIGASVDSIVMTTGGDTPSKARVVLKKDGSDFYISFAEV